MSEEMTVGDLCFRHVGATFSLGFPDELAGGDNPSVGPLVRVQHNGPYEDLTMPDGQPAQTFVTLSHVAVPLPPSHPITLLAPEDIYEGTK